jgi:ribosomal protein S7
MKKYVYINSDLFNELYYLYISTLVGKLIKKGNKTKAITLFNILKENIKLETNKKKEVSFIFLISMLNSLPKVSFKEIRLGSQKKDVPMPINKKKQVLVSVETLLKFSKKKKKVEFYNLMNHIISCYQNKGIIIRNKKLKYRKAIMNKMLLNIFMPRKQNRKEKNSYVSEKNNYQIFKNKTTL